MTVGKEYWEPRRPFPIVFPDFPEEDCPEIPEGWEDASVDTDMCPSWLVGGLRVFVDYIDVGMRWAGEGPRFAVCEAYLFVADDLFQSDNWADVVAFVEAHPLSQTLGISPQ